MPHLHHTLLFLLYLLFATPVMGQHAQPLTLTGTVRDADGGEALQAAVVTFSGQLSRSAITDRKGNFTLALPAGTPAGSVRVTMVGYKPYVATVDARRTHRLDVRLKASAEIAEVVVTAQEGRGLTGTSKIGRHAMEHLQPSSFADILELLPGGMASDPSLSAPNTIRLREVPISSADYATSSLGTAFVIDGARMSTNANMQYLTGAYDNTATGRDFTNEGVDMRSISTDDIESVEIVRGIPSVEYGDLTSGLVKINRRRGGHDLSARFKADMDSKLFYLSKAFEWEPHRLTLNLSADYLDNRADPRNVLETYSRITLSARLSKRWIMGERTADLRANVDYGGSFDRDKVDPELNYGGVDRYASSYNRWATDLSLRIDDTSHRSILRSLAATLSASVENDRTERTRLVQLSGETPAATSRTEGEADAVLITPYKYTATQTVEGIPVGIYAKLSAELGLPSLRTVTHALRLGADWQMDKNYGRGQIFDERQPLYPGVSTRPRAYSAIPASHAAGAYAELTATLPLGAFSLDVQAGLRASTLLHLPSAYTLHGKVYADPRVNLGLTFPAISVASRPMVFRLTGGIGQHTKNPTLDQLYPDKAYLDLVELNYWHENKDYRRVYLQTYVVDPTNPSLRAARNLKWEVALDATWWGNRIDITFFRENMTSGFRSMAIYAPYTYKKYDASGIDASALTDRPDIASLPYTTVSELRAHYVTTNGSQTLKKGVELTFSSRRWKAIGTRLTVTGAWFRSEYRNSQEVMERPSDVIGGKQVSVVGLYRDDDGYIREMYNTNFTFDTDIPRLKLGFSISAQCLWLTAKQSMPKGNTPTRYMTTDGQWHDFTEADAQDAELQFLVRHYNSSLYERQTVPFSMNLNLKATKKLMADRLMVALFVNKLWDAHPDYVRNNFRIRRYVTPYFGLELNMKI